MTDSVTLTLAQYAASTSIDSIPPAVREQAKLVIMDEMACASFGRRSVAGELIARYVGSLGGPSEARILGTSLRASAPYAAMANGTAGHGEDVDGAHVAGGHPGATIVHAAVAAAERGRMSGAELINAVVLGYDVGTRVMNACGGMFVIGSQYRLHSDFLYAVGAAVATSRLLGLDPTRHCHAMALVTFQANGLYSVFQERQHVSKPFSNGQYAFAGVSAAPMSAAGLTAIDDIVGARDGLLDAWGITNGAELVTRGLGTEYAIMGANFKFMSACYPIHAAAEAAMALAAEHAIDADRVESVRVGLPANAVPVVDNRPVHNTCMQDMMSAVLLRGKLSLRESPFPAILDDRRFERMRSRIIVGIDRGLERELPSGRGANVEIATQGGATFSQRIDWPRGHSRRGSIAWTDLAEKWQDALPDRDVERMLTLARSLESLDDVKTLTEAFA